MKRCLVLALAFSNAWAQSPVTAAPAFDVASIKPGVWRGVPVRRIGPNALAFLGTVKDMVREAYQVEDYRVAGLPAWAVSDLYDVEAKAAGEADSHQIRAMMQTLLSDRFQLKLHHETRTVPGYVLSADKNGPKLPPAKTDVPPGSEGVLEMGGGIVARASTIKHLAYGLTLELGQPVIDETNIEGNYNFRLRFDDGPDVAPNPAGGAGAAPTQSQGSAFTALREIGLKLDSRKVPIDVLVADSVEKPSEN